MDAVAIVLLFFGGLLAIAGQIWLWMLIYHSEPGWFIASLCLPFLCVRILATHPRRARLAGAVWITGLVLLLAGYLLWQQGESLEPGLGPKPGFTMPPAQNG
jgi:hypothetical protein